MAMAMAAVVVVGIKSHVSCRWQVDSEGKKQRVASLRMQSAMGSPFGQKE